MNQEKFEQWAIIELFGHQRIAGKVSNQEIGGISFIRIDVPETEKNKGFTKFYGGGAIYSITITNKITARIAAEHWQPEPFDHWSIDEMIQKQLSEPIEAQENID